MEITTKLELLAPGYLDYYKNLPNNYGADQSDGYAFKVFGDYVARNRGSVKWDLVAEFINLSFDSGDTATVNYVSSCMVEKLAENGHPLEKLLNMKAKQHWDCFK